MTPGSRICWDRSSRLAKERDGRTTAKGDGQSRRPCQLLGIEQKKTEQREEQETLNG